MGFRYYKIEGNNYPSCTTILSNYPNEVLDNWKKTTPDWEDVLYMRGLIGTLVHYRIAMYWSKNFGFPPFPLELTKEQRPKINRDANQKINVIWSYFLDWVKKYRPTPIEVEKVVHNHKLKYAGRTDGIFYIDDVVWLVDYKTSNGIWPEHHAQMSGYRMALEEMGYTIEKCGILHINEEVGEFVESKCNDDLFIKAVEYFYKHHHEG